MTSPEGTPDRCPPPRRHRTAATNWAGATLLAAGLSAALLSGAGVAVADDDTGGETSPRASNSAESKPNSATAPDRTKPDTTKPDTTKPVAEAEPVVASEPEDAEQRTVSPRKKRDRDVTPTAKARVTPSARASTPAAESAPKVDPNTEPKIAAKSASEPESARQTPDAPEPVTVVGTRAQVVAPTPVAAVHDKPTDVVGAVTAVVTTAVGALLDAFNPARQPNSPAAQPQLWTAAAAARREIETAFAAPSLAQPLAVVTSSGPSLINVIPTLAWNVFDTFSKLIDVRPTVPADSAVTIGRSTVLIDCGPGVVADADWYYPSAGEADKLIYFQHGFLARSFFYDVTLRELAERNNAIVVAPSITSNYFECHGCSLTGESMEAAVARLFEGDRTALAASALAAGYAGTLPDEFVFTGQSAGAILAAGASGFYFDNAPDADAANLVGVILYDVSASGGALAHALDSVPVSVPVLNIASTPALLNTGGNAGAVFAAKRPGRFNGVELVNGRHSDAFQSSAYGGLVQVIVDLGTGKSTPENIEAVQVLSQGWLTDMYAGRVYDQATRTGIYGAPGQPGQVLIDIPTDAGLARAYVLPGPPPDLSPIEQLIASFLSSLNGNVFATCQANSAAGLATTDPIVFVAGDSPPGSAAVATLHSQQCAIS